MPSKKILFLTTQLPYPPNSGGTVKSWNYVKHLAKNYTLSVGCLLKGDDQKHEHDFKTKVQLAAFFSESQNTPRTALNLLKSYLLSKSLNIYRNKNSVFKEKVLRHAKNVDIIILDHYEVFQFVPKEFKGKLVMHTHNAEFMLWQ